MNTKLKQGSIITVDFDPAKGSEIQKRRPAVVISRDEYQLAANLMIVCPITSTPKKTPYLVPVHGETLKAGSKVNTKQVYTMDHTEAGGRNVKVIGELSKRDFLMVAQHFLQNFNFPF